MQNQRVATRPSTKIYVPFADDGELAGALHVGVYIEFPVDIVPISHFDEVHLVGVRAHSYPPGGVAIDQV